MPLHVDTFTDPEAATRRHDWLALPRKEATNDGAAALAPAPVVTASLPALVVAAGERAAFNSVEFFTARIPNDNTRKAYGRAAAAFCAWCEARGVALTALSSPVVAAYFHELQKRLSASSANLHLSAIRHWLDWLTQKGVLPFNPAASVRGVRLSREEGKTPVLERAQARALLDSLSEGDAGDVVRLRDRAVIALMLFNFVRVGAVCRMRVKDFQEQNGEASIILHEKGGKERRLPAHPLAREYLR